MNRKEIRFNVINHREENDDLLLEGYAIVFDSETLIGDEQRGFYESIDKNALSKANVKDVPLRYNHSEGFMILARTRNKSLELKVDDKGLFIRAKLQKDIQTHVDIYNMVRSGLVSKMSFAFDIVKSIVKRDENNTIHKKITEIGRLYDVSIVDFPAYDETEVYARSLESLDDDLKTLENESDKQLLDKRNVLEVEKLKIKYKLRLIEV